MASKAATLLNRVSIDIGMKTIFPALGLSLAVVRICVSYMLSICAFIISNLKILCVLMDAFISPALNADI